MSVLIKRIPNNPVDSNSFVIYSDNNNSCIIIDPGTKDCNNLIEFISKEKLNPKYIILTHEHYDHIWGVNKLKDIYDVQLICSRDCAVRIVNKKMNMSVFYDQIGFETYPVDILVEDIKHKLAWNNINFEFINTPGHTDGSICIYFENYLITGDTLIKGEKTVTKLPGGSKEKLVISIKVLRKKFELLNPVVLAGHGESFNLCDCKLHNMFSKLKIINNEFSD